MDAACLRALGNGIPLRRSAALGAATIALCLAALATPSPAQTTPRQDFEGPQTSWTPDSADVQYRLLAHRRVRGEFQTGEASEQIFFEAGYGTTLYFSHPIEPARVIDELRPSLFVKADRQGMRLGARVVLPRSTNASGAPLTTILVGPSYTEVGRWQQLTLEDLPQLLERQARVLRLEHGPSVDPRGAYIDRLVLNVYAGAGPTTLLIDTLDLPGFVAYRNETPRADTPPAATARSERPDGPGRMISSRQDADEATRGPNVRLQGQVLTRDGQPVIPQAIDYHGESLEFLKSLGFNALRLSARPTPEMLASAQQLGLGLIAPPPAADELQAPSISHLTPVNELGPEYDPVWAWDLGRGLTSEEIEPTIRWARLVRLADRRGSRPLVGEPETDLRVYSRQLDAVLASQSPVGGSLSQADYQQWLRERGLLVRPGTPQWTTIQTQLDPDILAQWQAISGGRAPAQAALSSDEIRQLMYTAVAAGVRGLCFQSLSSLEANDEAARARARTLELVNLELELLTPWASAGRFTMTASAQGEPGMMGAVIQTERARLVLPLRAPTTAPTVPRGTDGRVSYIVPGVPESHKAFELTPAGMRPARSHRRVAGGMQVTLDEFDPTTLIVFTQDEVVLTGLSRRIARTADRAARLQRDLAAAELVEIERISQALGPAARPNNPLVMARTNLQQCDAQLQGGGNLPAAYMYARRTMRLVAYERQRLREQAIAAVGSPVASPLAAHVAGLPQHWALVNGLRTARAGGELLPGGTFEDFDAMQRAGWQHLHHRDETLLTAAELSAEGKRSGRYALHLQVKPADTATPPSLVESAPVWITSAPVRAEPGTIVRVSFWANAPQPIRGNLDGLFVFDSAGGPALGLRIGQTTGWRQYSLYRGVPSSGELTLTIALCGLGQAWIDDVSVQPVLRANRGAPADAWPGQGVPTARTRAPATRAGSDRIR